MGPVSRQAVPTTTAWSSALPRAEAEEEKEKEKDEARSLGLTRTIIEVCGEPQGAHGIQPSASIAAMPAEAGPPQLQAALQEKASSLDCSPPEVPRTSLPLVLIVE